MNLMDPLFPGRFFTRVDKCDSAFVRSSHNITV